jgi:hypothetical protein
MLLPFDPLLTMRLGDVRLSARLSTLLVLGLVGAGAAATRLEGSNGWVGGLGTVAIVLGVFAAHLAARLWTARRYGLAPRRCHLAVFGAVTDGLDAAPSPRAEALVGVVGLTALTACAGLAFGFDLLVEPLSEVWHAPIRTAALALLGLAIVQAMPALTLDGGQLLRGLVWYLTDSPSAGARAAALYAQVVAAGLLVFGVVAFAFDGALPFWGFWAVIAGWQLSAEARSGVTRLRWQRLARAVSLDDLTFQAQTIAGATTIDDALDQLLGAGGDAPFLVLGADRQPLGVLRVANLRGWPRSTWGERTVAQAMSPLTALPRLDAAQSAHEALRLLDDLEGTRGAVPGAPVLLIERDGRPVAAFDRRRVLIALHTPGRTESSDNGQVR